jgi:stage VI sporulation protein D
LRKEGGSDVHEPSGLRFDVYERVHLPQEAADIREIEEIELTPYVQAERQGDQVVLRGSLLLGGVYLPDDERRNSRQLEHWIPVEITLPLERVGRLEDLAVEVDNFDVDLLDKRTLNITGVLTLRGVLAGTAGGRQQTYAWGEEPYTVVHRRGRDPVEDAASETAGETAQPEVEAGLFFESSAEQAFDKDPAEWRTSGDQSADDAEGPGDADAGSLSEPAAAAASAGDGFAGQPELEPELEAEAVQAAGPVEWKAFATRTQENPAADAAIARQEAEPADDPESGPRPGAEQGASAADSGDAGALRSEQDFAEADEHSATAGPDAWQADAEPQQQQDETMAQAQSGDWNRTDDQQPAAAQPAFGKVDVKVAVGAKREDEQAGAESSAGLGKLFFPDRREARDDAGAKLHEAPEPPQAQKAAETGYRHASSDEVDWRSLFRGAAAQESFRTVRLCIVQKDDTLDAIALRYQRNPRELALVNRLNGSALEEGQVLYIP